MVVTDVEVPDLEEATEEFPEFTDAWYLLGYSHQNNDNQQGAKKAYEETVKANPDHKGANFELARYELDAGRYRSYVKLGQELKRLAIRKDARARRLEEQRWKQVAKAHRARTKLQRKLRHGL